MLGQSVYYQLYLIIKYKTLTEYGFHEHFCEHFCHIDILLILIFKIFKKLKTII